MTERGFPRLFDSALLGFIFCRASALGSIAPAFEPARKAENPVLTLKHDRLLSIVMIFSYQKERFEGPFHFLAHQNPYFRLSWFGPA